jgi:hypothetical protein
MIVPTLGGVESREPFYLPGRPIAERLADDVALERASRDVTRSVTESSGRAVLRQYEKS